MRWDGGEGRDQAVKMLWGISPPTPPPRMTYNPSASLRPFSTPTLVKHSLALRGVKKNPRYNHSSIID